MPRKKFSQDTLEAREMDVLKILQNHIEYLIHARKQGKTDLRNAEDSIKVLMAVLKNDLETLISFKTDKDLLKTKNYSESLLSHACGLKSVTLETIKIMVNELQLHIGEFGEDMRPKCYTVNGCLTDIF